MSGLSFTNSNLPLHITFQGDAENKIELFYDRDLKKWDCKITGEYSSSVDSFVKWVLQSLPVCNCPMAKESGKE